MKIMTVAMIMKTMMYWLVADRTARPDTVFLSSCGDVLTCEDKRLGKN
jgi:hypothetical protein